MSTSNYRLGIGDNTVNPRQKLSRSSMISKANFVRGHSLICSPFQMFTFRPRPSNADSIRSDNTSVENMFDMRLCKPLSLPVMTPVDSDPPKLSISTAPPVHPVRVSLDSVASRSKSRCLRAIPHR